MKKLRVHSIETFGTHEGPGIRLVVFLQGCNLRCLYCHNPDTWVNNDSVQDYSVKDILKKLEKEKSYFKDNGGLTVSGGEPTLQIEGLLALFKSALKAGFHTALDTNGFFSSKQVHQLYNYTDLILFDVKHINSEWHKKITGQGNDSILENIKYREDQGKPMWLRYVLVPGYSDQEEYLEELGRHFQDYQQVERIEILPYHTLGVHKYNKLHKKYRLAGVEPPTTQSIDQTKAIFEKYFHRVIIR